MKIYELAVHKPVIVTICLITLLTLGVISVSKLPVEFLPQMDFPFIGVFVPYPNALPTHVERQIVKPLEEVFSTLGDVRRMFSESSSEGAFVGVIFNWGRDVSVLRMEVKEKIDQIRNELPSDIEHLQIFTFNSNDQPIMVGRISAKGRDLMGSYDLLEKTILNPLKRIDGVGRVAIDGIEPQEVSIYLELDRLKAHRVDVDALFAMIQTMNLSATLGEVTSKGLRYNVRGVGNFTDLAQVENLRINESGLRLKDIADIYYGEPAITYGRHLNGETAIAFWIQKSSGANVVELTKKVQATLEKINQDPRLEGLNILLWWNQAEQILNSLNSLKWAGIIGALFAVSTLYFFLRRLSTTLIVAVAIPFAIMCTCGFLFFAGKSLNVLTMMGLMLGVGMLVDNAIVVLESIFRHQSAGEESRSASIVGSREVATAVVAATLTSVIVFAPVIFTYDSSGLMTYLSEVGITISVALLFSLLISLTLIPFLTSRLLKPKKAKDSSVLKRLEDRYVRSLQWTTQKRPFLTGFVIIPVILILSLASVKLFKLEFDMDEGELVERIYIAYEFTDNLTYDQTEKYVNQVEETLFARKDELRLKDVYSYYADNEAGTSLYFQDKYLSEKRLKQIREQLREELPQLAGATLRLGDEEGGSSGGVKQVQVTLFGEDIIMLQEYADEVKRRLSLLEGIEDVRTSIELGKEEIKIALNRELARQYEISPQSISGIMNLTFRGMPLRRFQMADREVPMTISLSPEDRIGMHNLKNLLIGMNEEKELTLGTVADLSVSRGPTTIRRQHQKAAVSVQGFYDQSKFKGMTENVAAVMNSIQFPLGYSWSFDDRYREQQQQKNYMLFNILLALLCVYLVMASLFESLLHPWIIMSCLPFALIGVVLALIVTSTSINIMAMIGMVILIGIVVNNGIVLIDHVNNFRRQGTGIYEAILMGGRERFRPILMTAVTTILGLMPMAIGRTNLAGTQYYPLARALIGGLAMGTLLTLVALPTYYIIGERQLRSVLGIWQAARRRRRPGVDPTG
jgi:HAE1 family hydrophobic/amphiphilic exporter-1